MAKFSVVDFAAYRQSQGLKQRPGDETLGEFALTMCEETFLDRDWERFGYWHRTYLRVRRPPRTKLQQETRESGS